VGQRTFETRSLYLILAEKLFTLPAANEMLPLSALFAGRYREVGQCSLVCLRIRIFGRQPTGRGARRDWFNLKLQSREDGRLPGNY
jgi:hypothetical protein